MNFSDLEIKNIEGRYNLDLPVSLRKMLTLIGGKILDISLKSIMNGVRHERPRNLSIYDIQDEMLDGIEDVEDFDFSTLCNPNNIFFLTISLYRNEVTNISYFINANGQNDSPVYSWITDIADDDNDIRKFSDSIEEWLFKINPILYIELQARKIFFDKPQAL